MPPYQLVIKRKKAIIIKQSKGFFQVYYEVEIKKQKDLIDVYKLYLHLLEEGTIGKI